MFVPHYRLEYIFSYTAHVRASPGDHRSGARWNSRPFLRYGRGGTRPEGEGSAPTGWRRLATGAKGWHRGSRCARHTADGRWGVDLSPLHWGDGPRTRWV